MADGLQCIELFSKTFSKYVGHSTDDTELTVIYQDRFCTIREARGYRAKQYGML